MSAPARADSTLRGANGRTVLAVRVFQGNLAVSKGEQITTMDFDASAVCQCSRERPLRHSPLPTDKMARVAPVGIGEGCPDLREASSHGLPAYIPGAADLRAHIQHDRAPPFSLRTGVQRPDAQL